MPTLRRDPDGTWTVVEDSPGQFNPVPLAVAASVLILAGVGYLGFKAATSGTATGERLTYPEPPRTPATRKPESNPKRTLPPVAKPATPSLKPEPRAKPAAKPTAKPAAEPKTAPLPVAAKPEPESKMGAGGNPIPRSNSTPPNKQEPPPAKPTEPKEAPVATPPTRREPPRPPLQRFTLPPNGERASTFVPPRRDYVPPVYGQIRLGAFAGEAAHLAGITYISTVGLSDPARYAEYRESVHQTYGVDLEDMNYFSLEAKDLDSRIRSFQAWLLMAGRYGDVTVALEPPYDTKFEVFHDSATMAKLAVAFQRAKEAGITVWIRFASESNLHGSKYSVTDNPDVYHDAAAEFKAQMPDNVKLVFSPLINTFVAGSAAQRPLAARMYLGQSGKVVWDRIGGTIYRTDQPLEPTYRAYYDFMSSLDPKTPFQICEVGGPYSRRQETLAFLKTCSSGGFPRLVKVNLFARDINRRADPNAEFGFIEPSLKSRGFERAVASKRPSLAASFLKPVLSASRRG
ncbi:MAG: hypothetical protein JSS71_04455 [Armatimonadetes bacterium]|nr:hypothetical protein [Armatimonadota bacterium]MBX3108635.1 hypothetical protein [Fimbriimonadaceae bacterium]